MREEPSDDEGLADDLQWSHYAQQLAENPLLTKILDDKENDCILHWKHGIDKDSRETAWHSLQAVRSFRSGLLAAINSGKVASAHMRQEKK